MGYRLFSLQRREPERMKTGTVPRRTRVGKRNSPAFEKVSPQPCGAGGSFKKAAHFLGVISGPLFPSRRGNFSQTGEQSPAIVSTLRLRIMYLLFCFPLQAYTSTCRAQSPGSAQAEHRQSTSRAQGEHRKSTSGTLLFTHHSARLGFAEGFACWLPRPHSAHLFFARDAQCPPSARLSAHHSARLSAHLIFARNCIRSCWRKESTHVVHSFF